jgi:multidrug resistance efflux pump
VRGSVSTTILGSGQVSASNQVDITSEVSGTVLYVGARAGDSISSGKSILLLDSTDAKRTVENAELNLENAKIHMKKRNENLKTNQRILMSRMKKNHMRTDTIPYQQSL